MNILTLDDAITVTKENRTMVNYYLFDEYEIHLNTIPAHSVQEWHYHTQIEEVILVTKGELICEWLQDEKKCSYIIHRNELVQVKQSVHTFSNGSENDVEFVVFRLVLDGKNKRELIKNDKRIVSVI